MDPALAEFPHVIMEESPDPNARHLTPTPVPTSTRRQPIPSPCGHIHKRQAKPTAASTVDTIRLGICCMRKKLTTSTMEAMVASFEAMGIFEIVPFAEEAILAVPPEEWPLVDVMISFYSKGFPLDKAIRYAELNPDTFFLTEPASQRVLLDRRDFYSALAHNNVPIVRMVYCNRDGYRGAAESTLEERPDYIVVDGVRMDKPFVEKPVSAEDHAVFIYYKGGGGRRLFRKVKDRSSEFDPAMSAVRRDGSFVYEEFINTEEMVDVKCYTVGFNYVFAEARKAPTKDGIVVRREDGKESRETVALRGPELVVARKVVKVFRQMVCGFDILRDRASDRYFVCDVNGWSFVKNVPEYVERATAIMRDIFVEEVRKRGYHRAFRNNARSRELCGVVGVMRHADRTPKQKVKIVVNIEPLLVAIFSGDRKVRDELVLKSGHPKLESIHDLVKHLLVSSSSSDETGGGGGSASDLSAHSGEIPVSMLSPKISFATPQPELLPPSKGTGAAFLRPASASPAASNSRNRTPHGRRRATEGCTSPTADLAAAAAAAAAAASPSPHEAFHCYDADTENPHRDRIAGESPSCPPLINIGDVVGMDHATPRHHDPTAAAGTMTLETHQAAQNGCTSPDAIVKYEIRLGDNASKTILRSLRLMADVLDRSREGLKIQVKPKAWDASGNCIEALLVCKWGGWLTEAGHKQAAMMGRHFVDHAFYGEVRHVRPENLSVESNNERRVIHTAVEFARGLLKTDDIDERICHVNEALLGSTANAKALMGEFSVAITAILHSTTIESGPALAVANTPGMRAILECPVLDDDDDDSLTGCQPSAGGTRKSPRAALAKLHTLVKAMLAAVPVSSRRQPGASGSHEPVSFYRGESVDLVEQRWETLSNAFYVAKTDTYDVSKIPVIFDHVSYDVSYNQACFAPHDLYPLFTLAEALSAFVSDAEFGLTTAQKRLCCAQFAAPLLQRILSDLRSQALEHKRPALRMYFTSESHVTGLKNLLYSSSPAFLNLGEPMELHFLSHIVFKIYRYRMGSADSDAAIHSDTTTTTTVATPPLHPGPDSVSLQRAGSWCLNHNSSDDQIDGRAYSVLFGASPDFGSNSSGLVAQRRRRPSPALAPLEPARSSPEDDGDGSGSFVYQIEVHFSLGIDKNMFGIVQEHHTDYAAVTPMIRIHNNLELEQLEAMVRDLTALGSSSTGGGSAEGPKGSLDRASP